MAYKYLKCKKPDKRKQYHKFSEMDPNHLASQPAYPSIHSSRWCSLSWFLHHSSIIDSMMGVFEFPINIYIFFLFLSLSQMASLVQNRSLKFMVFGITLKMNLTFHQSEWKKRLSLCLLVELWCKLADGMLLMKHFSSKQTEEKIKKDSKIECSCFPCFE